jgi:hypothetical protein
VAICNVIPCFGILYFEKSGNPGVCVQKNSQWNLSLIYSRGNLQARLHRNLHYRKTSFAIDPGQFPILRFVTNLKNKNFIFQIENFERTKWRHCCKILRRCRCSSLTIDNQHFDQGCQVVCFQTKNKNFGKFGRAVQWGMLVYFMEIWSTYFIAHLVYFKDIGYILW